MMAVMPAVLARPGAKSVDFDAWMRAEQQRVFRLCCRLLQDSDEADTATQDAFLKAYRAWERKAAELDVPSRWLTTIAVNTCLDVLRSRRWRFWRRWTGGDHAASVRDAGPGPEARIFADQISVRLAAALERLSARQRSIFVLRHYEDRPLGEIAAILGLDTGTVKAHMARAVAKLREELRDLYFQKE
jgi:RNA polymerase sigma-70 factor (ECF subfamily)